MDADDDFKYDELDNQIIEAITCSGAYWDYEQRKAIRRLIEQEIAKARRSERLEVALDNYRGQTFSESTNYKSKFDKFVRNNEIRIEQLTIKEHKEL